MKNNTAAGKIPGDEKTRKAESAGRNIFDRLVPGSERSVKNYVNPWFWLGKRNDYRKIRQKERQDQNVFETLSAGAQPSIEYYILTILSCIIATIGLIQNSTATVIGAMIVAPLMTPILAFSLGVIWGDTGLIRTSIGSIFKGTALALVISSCITWLIPFPGYSQEILARTNPTLFDILVAIASGIVGAYGNANRRVSNSLVGIAIAIALMPPLCTIGIGIGTFNMAVARGAATLFVINLISMSFAGAVVFWVLKVHPASADREQVKKRALYQIVLSLLILGAISVPAGVYMYRQAVLESEQKRVFEALKTAAPGLGMLEMKYERRGEVYVVNVVLSGDVSADENAVRQMKRALLAECGTSISRS